MCGLIEPMFTTEPWPAARIIGTTAWVAKKWWRTLISMNSSHLDALSVSTGMRSSFAALLTSTVTGPSCSPVAAIASCRASMSRTSQCW